MVRQTKRIEEIYQKREHHEHVLKSPGMFIGSIDTDVEECWIYDQGNDMIVKKSVAIIPGLYKIFDEIIVNAIDHVTRMERNDGNPVKTIKVNIDKNTGSISVMNDGDGIEVVKHLEYNIYIPELIFGNMLTSTNYDEDDVKTIGGQNGIGAKACNIYSKSFTLETVDAERKLSYIQEFKDNMSIKTDPKIKSCSKKPYTRVTFTPDYERFKIFKKSEEDDVLTDDLYGLFTKRCYDLCALTDPSVTVWLNDTKLVYKTFERYVDLYLGPKSDKFRVYEKINDRWEIVISFTDKIGLEQVSFVNGIWTMKGGKHVDYIVNQVANKLCEMIAKKRKNVDVKPNHVKNYLMVFVKSTIDNPGFDSQSKNSLTTLVSKFGSKADVSEKLIEKLYKSDIIDHILNLCDKNAQILNKKSDGKKQNKIRGLPKLDDANWAGTNKSKECSLLLVEGDSAKTMVLEGLSEVGRDKYGVFPLRGKLMNVKDANDKKMVENKEIQSIKKILGLESGKKYKSTDELRYGRIILLTDSDVDGSHIKGLIMNVFHTLWPTLLLQDDFIVSMVTPIVKVTKGNAEHSFYNLTDYQNWFKETNCIKDWKIKYYKGLGTSNDEEAKSYFRNIHTIQYKFDNQKNVDHVFNLAFDKKNANNRKTWIGQYDPQLIINSTLMNEIVGYDDFVNKELIHFSVYDVKRSIPSMVDGLKPSQRKVMFAAFKRKLIHEIKVSQFAGYISEHAAYHHGEASLQATIVGMAQDFVGSNNMQLLMPNGMFGSRNMGGKDAAQARYIFTQIDPLAFKTFIKEDSQLLNYLDDDGYSIEPDYYVPVIPMLLVNGATGIGTGYSTSIPPFNPTELIDVMKNCIINKGTIEDDVMSQLKPWFRGFSGQVKPCKNGFNHSDDNSYQTYKSCTTHGCYTQLSPTSVEITELPIGTWTDDYKEFLENYLVEKPKVLKDYESHSTKKIKFILHFNADELEKLIVNEDKFESEFKLVNKNVSLTNMHAFNEKGIIQKYESVKDIIESFYKVRYNFYVKRKLHNVQSLKGEIEKANAKAVFIKEVMENKIKLMGRSRDDVNKTLCDREYPMIDGDHGYLLRMPIYTFTKEKYDELLKDVDDLNKQLQMYENEKEEDIWINELNDLADAYRTHHENHMEKMKGNKQKNIIQKNGKVKAVHRFS
jgi:DNA topoisomerase-2